MSGEIDSAWMKWGWGLRHVQEIRALHSAWASGGTVTPVSTFDATTSELVLSFTGITEPPAAMSLHLADALGAFRQSLDHAARVMVDRAGNPGRNSYFVLRTDKPGFVEGMKNQMPGVTGTDYRLMEELHETSVWIKGSNPDHTPLIIMRDLNNFDKHNAITATASLPAKATVKGTFTDCTQAGPFRGTASGPLIDGAEMIRVLVDVTGPNPALAPLGTIEATATISRFLIEDLVNHIVTVIADGVLTKLQKDPPASMYTLGVKRLRPALGSD